MASRLSAGLICPPGLLAKVASFDETSIREGILDMLFGEKRTHLVSPLFATMEVIRVVIMVFSGTNRDAQMRTRWRLRSFATIQRKSGAG